jgi:phosphohistidine phosphatase
LKTLLIIRHAKSDQRFLGNDFERPLNERGKTDAPVMAKRLLDKNIIIDAFISSPAKRAKKTAEIFCGSYNKLTDEIIFVTPLYHAPSEVFYEVIQHIDDGISSAAIFSHNPGITDFANSLTNARLDNMPTCAVFAVQVPITKWADFTKAEKKFLFFDYPKNAGAV